MSDPHLPTIAELDAAVADGSVKFRPHPEDPDVCVYNYSAVTSFKGPWNHVTLRTRGLILNRRTGEWLANPFPKFFNLGQHHDPIPNEVPVISEKLDGSLGIIYWLNDQPWVATRGSMDSEQALWATRWLREHVDCSKLPTNRTFLVEIIYPENRVVVNYDFAGLVLLAVRYLDINSWDIEWPDNLPKIAAALGLRAAGTIESTDLAALSAMSIPNSEGFVVHYRAAGLRLKVKLAEYVRLHRILTGVSEKRVWELLRNGDDIAGFLEAVPDEFFQWFSDIKTKLEKGYADIEADAKRDFRLVRTEGLDRKAIAAQIVPSEYRDILFYMLDGKTYTDAIWKRLRPERNTAFRCDFDAV